MGLGEVSRPMKCHWRERITQDPDHMHGEPCVRRLPITVAQVLLWLDEGLAKVEILRQHPDLEWDDF